MGNAFAAGYDPVLALASAELYEEERHDTGKRKKKPGMIRRREQDYIDRVINGEVAGEYLLLLGPKGTGKTTLMVEAMIKSKHFCVCLQRAVTHPVCQRRCCRRRGYDRDARRSRGGSPTAGKGARL